MNWIDESFSRLQRLERLIENRPSFVPVVTGTTPAIQQDLQREEKNTLASLKARKGRSDRQLMQIYLDNFHWFFSVGSHKVNASKIIVQWKLDNVGGMAAAW